jgi:hypothetical protein
LSHCCSIEVEQRDSTRLVVAAANNCKAVINMSPFIVDVICDGEHILSLNSRSLFRFDFGHQKSQ